jgi:hypothetical protein
MRNRIRRIIRESLDELGSWFDETVPTFKEWGFDFDGKHEYWVDISMLNVEGKELVFDYIKSKVPYKKDFDTNNNFKKYMWKGIIIHCATDAWDDTPEENGICFMIDSFDKYENSDNSLYVDGGEVLEYIKAIKNWGLKESLNWGDKDSVSWAGDPNWSTDPNYTEDPNWKSDPKKSYWEKSEEGGSSSGGSTGGGETVTEEEDLETEDPFSWLRDTEEHPNYNGHPQGVVYLHGHDEIDEFCDIIENYNGGILPRGDARENLHRGLEYRRNDLEEDERDASEAVLSASFFVERGKPGVLSVGYWDYDVDHETIREWFNYDDQNFNQEYRLHTNLNDVRKVFDGYQNPEL